MSTGVLSLYGHEHCLWHYTGENMDTVLVAETGENMAVREREEKGNGGIGEGRAAKN